MDQSANWQWRILHHLLIQNWFWKLLSSVPWDSLLTTYMNCEFSWPHQGYIKTSHRTKLSLLLIISTEPMSLGHGHKVWNAECTAYGMDTCPLCITFFILVPGTQTCENPLPTNSRTGIQTWIMCSSVTSHCIWCSAELWMNCYRRSCSLWNHGRCC